jgi:hypothetical protein
MFFYRSIQNLLNGLSNSDSMCLTVLIGGFLDSKFYRFDFLSRGIIKELVDESLLIKQIG